MQFQDRVRCQFGGAAGLLRFVLIVDRKLFRGLDGSFERILRIFQSNIRLPAIAGGRCLPQFLPERCRPGVILLTLGKLGQFSLSESLDVSWEA